MSSGRHQQRHMVVRDWRRQGNTLFRPVRVCVRKGASRRRRRTQLTAACARRPPSCGCGPHPAATPLAPSVPLPQLATCIGIIKSDKKWTKNAPTIYLFCTLFASDNSEIRDERVGGRKANQVRNSPDFGGAAFSCSLFWVYALCILIDWTRKPQEKSSDHLVHYFGTT